jgi:hypothetical protein
LFEVKAIRSRPTPVQEDPVRKLGLSLEALKVESFETLAPEPSARGTVHANGFDTKEICDSTRGPRDCVCSRYCPTFEGPGCSIVIIP